MTLGRCPQMVTENQAIIMEFMGSNYLLSISQVMVKDKTGTLASGLRGRLVPATAFVFNAASGSGITVGGQRNIAAPKLFKVAPGLDPVPVLPVLHWPEGRHGAP